jgi:hypothetical protein
MAKKPTDHLRRVTPDPPEAAGRIIAAMPRCPRPECASLDTRDASFDGGRPTFQCNACRHWWQPERRKIPR